MVSATDILLTIKTTEDITKTFKNIEGNAGKLGSALGSVGMGAGLAMAQYGKSAMDSAIQAESAWNRFGANINSQGGNWNAQSKEIKSWISTFSNSMGRSVGDTRSAATALMNYGMSWDEVKSSMDGIAGLAAKTGSTEEEASNVIISALNGRAQALRKATGLNIADYKAQDGSIDRARLMRDIINSTGQAKSMFADSDEAKMQRMENGLAKLKTTIGQGIVQFLTPLIPIINSVVNAFSSMPGSLQPIVGLIFAVATGFSIIAGPIQNAISLLGSFRSIISGIIPVITGLNSSEIVSGEVALSSAMAHSSSATSIGISEGAYASLAGAINAETAAENTGMLATIRNNASKVAHAIVTGASTVASWGLAAAQWAVNAAMSANPIGIVIIALVALVAIIYKVGEAFGWWDSVSGMLNAIWQGIMKIGNAFASGIGAVVSGFVSGLVNAFTLVGNAINWVVNGIRSLVSSGSIFGTFVSIVLGPAFLVYNVLKKIVCIVVGCSPGIIPAFQQLAAVAGGIWNSIASVITGIVSGIVNSLTSIISGVRQIPARMWSILVRCINTILNFSGQAFIYMLNAGLRMLTGISTFLRQLPARLGTFFSTAVGRILSFVGQGLANAMNFGRNILNGVMKFITDIPGKVYTEFVNIGKRIKDAVAGAVQAAMSFGSDVLNAVMGALGIHSPGYIQNNIATEFANIPGRILSQRLNAFNAAQTYGQAIMDGFGNPSLSVGSDFSNINGSLTSNIKGLSNVMGSAPVNNGGGTTIINVSEGAFHNSFDARSFTEKECKQILGNATRNLNPRGN